jgi:hypothetical protein
MLRIIVILWTVFCGYCLFSGVGQLDSDMLSSSDAYSAGAGIGIIAILLLWGVVVVPVSVIGMLFKKS